MKLSDYCTFLPEFPYSGNSLDNTLMRRDRISASGFDFIQCNSPAMKRGLTFDIDHRNAFEIIEDSGLPKPNVTVYNRLNGHAHATYLIGNPVGVFGASRKAPVMFYRAIERAYTRRLKADWGYTGFMMKCPFSQRWECDWGPTSPYEMAELDDVLTFSEKRWKDNDVEIGTGRNVTLFNSIRVQAYSQVNKIRKSGGTIEDLSEFVTTIAYQVNVGFRQPLLMAEVESTVRSVTDWTWDHIQEGGLSEYSRNRVMKRWLAINGREIGKPWVEEGISRSLWYRRNRSKTLST